MEGYWISNAFIQKF